ncbi:MAG TPA: site-specific integrase [Blastocatellia bacterium]|nr:site-specific integrase [Blastocatellia bacterium]
MDAENKTRAKRKEFQMARRKTYQKANPKWHYGHWTVRYWEFDHQTGAWKQKRAKLAGCDDKNNKKAAREAADAFMAQVNERNNNPLLQGRGLTFAAFIKGRYASFQTNRELQPSTLASYESMVKKHILPAFGHKLITEITPADLTDFFDALRTKVSGKYAANLYALLNSMFEVACQYDLIEKKPIRSMLHKPKYEIAEKPTLSVKDVRKVINSLDGGYQMLIVMLSVFPVRLGEALALRWTDIDFDARELYIRNGLWKGKLKPKLKTKASERMFHVPGALADLLLAHRSRSSFNGPEDFIFCNSVGQPFDPDNLRHRVLYPVMDALGIEREKRRHGFHIFRHTAGSVLHGMTGDLKLVQETLGHSRISTTADTYVHLDRAVAETATEILSQAVLGDCDRVVTVASEMIN